MRIIFLTLILFACSTKKPEPIATINLKEIELDFSELTPLDSIELTSLIETYLKDEWEPDYHEVINNMPKAYVENHLDIPNWRNENIDYFLDRYQAYWLNLKIGNELKPYIITTNGSDPESWIDEGYELSLYHPNFNDDSLNPTLLGKYWHFMAITSFEENPTIEFYENGDIKVVSFSGGCSDIITDEGLYCVTVTTTQNFSTLNSQLKLISSDTVRMESTR